MESTNGSHSKSENKYRNWVFTWNTDSPEAYAGLRLSLSKVSDTYVFQKEIGLNTKRLHIQGAFKTFNRVRKTTLLTSLAAHLKETISDPDKREELYKLFQVNRMCGTWEEAFAYSTKKETQVDLPVFSDNLLRYNGEDINMLGEKENRYPWQQNLIEVLFTKDETDIKTPDDRTIIWVTDPKGNTGKSKFVKYLCFNYPNCVKVSFGTATQLRSALVSVGQKKLYFIDIPRTLGEDDSIKSLISALEDLKNGYVVSTMYGKHSALLMNPPSIVVFSNKHAPKDMMSNDRWITYIIDEDKHMYTYDRLYN